MERKRVMRVLAGSAAMVVMALGLSFLKQSSWRAIAVAEAAPTAGTFTEETDDAYHIQQDTVWKKGDTLTFDKEVIVSGLDAPAKLTIEPGAEVHINGDDIRVWYGSIVAEGTAADPVTFLSDDNKPFSIEFLSGDDAGASSLAYTRIVGGGDHRESECIPMTSRDGFWVKTAHAAEICVFDRAAVRYMGGGVLTIDHTDFVRTKGIDIESELRIDTAFPSGSALTVSNSSLADNAQKTALVSTVFCSHNFDSIPCSSIGSERLRMERNWYGSSIQDDPKWYGAVTNKVSFGGMELRGTFFLDGWLMGDPFPERTGCVTDCASNVLFLPGLEASRLYTKNGSGDENQLWEPNREADVEKLFLDGDGKSLRDDIYTRDVIDEKNVLPVGQGNIYKSFLHDLADWKSSDVIADYAAVPYDWRLSLDDILSGGQKDGGNISYSNSGEYIVSELRRLAGTSKSGKVTIVAHSNGGLLTKALVRKLGDAEAKRLIDDIVFVAVPQNGTPQAIGALLHGDDQGLPFDWLPLLLGPKTARTLASNMPGAYHLLTSEAYFQGEGSGVDTPVVKFDDGASTEVFTSKYGNKIDSFAELWEFLSDTAGKVAANATDVLTPGKANEDLLAYGKNTHQLLDDWTVPDGITLYQIAGTGEETMGTLRYWTGQKCTAYAVGWCVARENELLYTPEMVTDGDGTVTVPSALATASGPKVKRYWVNLFDYNDDNIDRKHAEILEVPELRSFIKDVVLTQSTNTLPAYLSDTEPPITSENRLRFYLHSPLTLSVRDSEGHEAGAHAADIPGASYQRFGELQYISLPASAKPTVVLDGQEAGSFTLEAQEVEDGVVKESATFTGIPTSPETVASMTFPDGTLSQADPLVVDYDGDGDEDMTLEASLGEVVMPKQDTDAPVTTPTVNGSQGANEWFTSDVSVELVATDGDGSGVEKTEYSLDDGVSWNIYTGPIAISQEGRTHILYTSTDKVGNREDEKLLVVKRDKTAPEARISFNPETKTLDVVGQDTLDQSVDVILSDVATGDSNRYRNMPPWLSEWFRKKEKKEMLTKALLTDEAGHTTEIVFKKESGDRQRIEVDLRSVAYDGVKTTPKAEIEYRWSVQRDGKYRLLGAEAETMAEKVKSVYLPRRNATYIMTQSRESDDDRERFDTKTVSGMAIIGLETEKGSIKIGY